MIKGSCTGCREAKHESIKGKMMEAPAPQGKAVVFFVAAFTVAAIQVFQAEYIAGCFASGAYCGCSGLNLSPVADGTFSQGKHSKPQSSSKNSNHSFRRKNNIETTKRDGEQSSQLQCNLST